MESRPALMTARSPVPAPYANGADAPMPRTLHNIAGELLATLRTNNGPLNSLDEHLFGPSPQGCSEKATDPMGLLGILETCLSLAQGQQEHLGRLAKNASPGC